MDQEVTKRFQITDAYSESFLTCPVTLIGLQNMCSLIANRLPE